MPDRLLREQTDSPTDCTARSLPRGEDTGKKEVEPPFASAFKATRGISAKPTGNFWRPFCIRPSDRLLKKREKVE